jgi:hypothetical protein
MFFSLSCGFALLGCPLFTEILPDPQDTVDAYGEFVEIRLGSNFSINDTLFIQFENKKEYPFTEIKASRLLLHRDTSTCKSSEFLDCRPFPFSALPNSRNSFWSMRSLNCVDSAVLPMPQNGKSFQRYSSEKDSWVYVLPTPGEANSQYESDIKDCAIRVKQAKYTEKKWHIQLQLSKCDSSSVKWKILPLMYQNLEDSGMLSLDDSLWIDSRFESSSILFMASLSSDENSHNNSIDTLLFLRESPPIYLTEIHHCPEEPMPEWVEIYSQVNRALSLSSIGFGRRGLINSSPIDSIEPHQSLVITKDTLAFRQAIEIMDLSVKRAPLGYLKNASDTLFLTYKNDVLDSVIWNKELNMDCPYGFNPKTKKMENTPGFQGRVLKNSQFNSPPFTFKINTRIVSKTLEESSLRILIESEGDVLIELLSGQGNLLWQIKNKALNQNWIQIPIKEKGFLGPNFIRISVGRYEKMVGVVLRP